MADLQFRGTLSERFFRDVGTPADPKEIKDISVVGIYSVEQWVGGGKDRLIGDALPDLFFFDDLTYQSPRIVGISTIYSGDGDDLVDFTSTRFSYGSLSVFGGNGNDRVLSSDGADTLHGGAGKDILKGYANKDKIFGDAGNDTIFGGVGADTLYGGSGRDILVGGEGRDILNGNAGADRFVFQLQTDSRKTVSGRDTIVDFTHGDKIDLSTIDADTKSSKDQRFKFISDEGFHKHAGELRFENSGFGTDVYGDVNGDGKADFSIHLQTVIGLKSFDFIL